MQYLAVLTQMRAKLRLSIAPLTFFYSSTHTYSAHYNACSPLNDFYYNINNYMPGTIARATSGSKGRHNYMLGHLRFVRNSKSDFDF